ncbi:hypothetical protein A9F13_02g01144 [Clavispora lusitaniae]|uniref:Uncharacterized protein n=1 Tax=Clavispora lusitaniae TaxID=36911 RepID=A0AA91Q3Q6_CLALS|nr:hypothetical protein A9F13_02g01144 [Clavispora lusitaniae]
MASRESQEGLLELENLQNTPEYPLYPNDPMMSLEVEFQMWKRLGSSSKLVRLVLNENTTVEEASEKAFLETLHSLPKDRRVLIRRKDSDVLSTIVDMNVQIKHLVKEDDILVLLDSFRGYMTRMIIFALINLAATLAVAVASSTILITSLSQIDQGHANESEDSH